MEETTVTFSASEPRAWKPASTTYPTMICWAGLFAVVGRARLANPRDGFVFLTLLGSGPHIRSNSAGASVSILTK